jgi:hypothetical protein
MRRISTIAAEIGDDLDDFKALDPFFRIIPPVTDDPYLLERESTSWLRKEIESREPEGPQDSTRTQTATACQRSEAR